MKPIESLVESLTTTINQYKKEGIKYIYVQRNDNKHNGSVIDIPVDTLAMTLKIHPTWKVIETVKESEKPAEVKIDDAPKTSKLQCPICGKEYKTERALKAHKTKMHK